MVWNTPEVEELVLKRTADIKPSCFADKGNGTCTYWCNASANGKNPACPYNGGYCKGTPIYPSRDDS